MTTTDTPSLSDVIFDTIKAGGGEPVGPDQITEAVRAAGLNNPAGSISATTASLAGKSKDSTRYGIVRLAPSLYAYRPDDPNAVIVKRPKQGAISAVVRGIFEQYPSPMSTRQVAERSGLSHKQVNQSIGYLVKNDPHFTRVQNGLYTYIPNGAVPVTNAEFAPVDEAIPDAAFGRVGLKVVARTKDGDRLCIDEHGTAWAVRVTITAQMV